MSLKTPLSLSFLALIVLPSGLGQVKTAEKPTPAQDFSKEAYSIDRSYTRMTAESDGTGTRETTVEVKMLAEAGVKTFAVLNFAYTSANETVEFDYVRVRKPDGTIVKTPDYNIQDMPGEVTRTAPLYSDIHEKHVAVKGLGVGDELEYLIRYRVTKPEVPGHFWYEYTFTKHAIAKDERLELSVPREKYVKVVSPEFKPEVAEDGTRRTYRWTHANLVVPQKDPDEIPRRIPPNPDVQITTFASWEEVGRWYGDLQKDPMTVTAAIQAKAAELTKGLNTNEEKIRALYSFVSLKYHYIGLDFGIGRYQPHAADDVLDNGYGDCKDKHTLLAALLKAAGIDAWPVLIHNTRRLDPDVPSPAQFNHVITVVPQGEKYTWLDTTPEVAPYRLLMVTLRNKQALMIPVDQPAKLVTTPENPPEPQRQEFSMAGKLSADGVLTGHVEMSNEGDSEVLLRAAFRQVPESQWRELMQRFSYAMSFGGDVSNVTVSPPDALDKPLEISYDYVRKNFAGWDDHQTSVALPPMGIEIMKDAKDRKPPDPVLLGGLGTVTYRSRVDLPPGYTVIVPSRCHLVQPFAEYDGYTRVEQGVMTTTRVLKIKKSEVPLSNWEEYRTFGRAIYDDEFNMMTVNHSGAPALKNRDADKGKGTEKDEFSKEGAPKPSDEELDSQFRDGLSALQARDFQRAQEIYEEVVAKDPNYKGAHFNLGLALMSQSNVTAAVDQFRKEEEVSPNDERSYQVLATYLTQQGRRDDAIEQWRKLLKVQPENRTAASALGGLLYRAGKYSEAAEALETAVKSAPDSPGLLMQLGETYVKSGNPEKATATLRKAAEQKADDPDTLNNVAYSLADNKLSLDLAQQYAEKALHRLDGESQDSDSSNAALHVTYQLSLTWDTLGWVYYRQGDLKRAESLIRSAWLLGEEAIVAEHLGEIYEKEGKPQLAAQTYEYALAVSSIPRITFGSQPDPTETGVGQVNDIIARYEKLTGKKPSTEIRRLPNGEWTKTPAEKLRLSRELKLRNDKKLSGSAQFIVTIKPAKVDSAEYARGDHSLDALSDELTSAHYPFEFPPQSVAVLTVRLDVSCRSTTPCTATLVPPVADAAPVPITFQ